MIISFKLELNNLVVSIFKEQDEILLVDSLYKRSPWTQEEIDKIIMKYEEEWYETN